jgi:enamine deaminase RidA (YjgF/YER057c/UK114 family)
MSADAMIEELALELPWPFPPAGTYVNAVRTGGLLALGGHIPIGADRQVVLGKLGDDLDVDAGRAAARLAALSALATLLSELGSLDRVLQVVWLRGFVNATPDFTGHTQVIDGASDVLVQVFAERGRHARLAVGVSSLPANLALEIELLVEIGDDA